MKNPKIYNTMKKHHSESLPLVCMIKVYFDQLYYRTNNKKIRTFIPMTTDEIDALEEDIKTYKVFLDELKKYNDNLI